MREYKKYAYFDYLSIASCMAVLYMHHNGLAHHYENSIRWFLAMGIECICFWAVPVFFMISGAKLMDYRQRHTTKEYFLRRIEKVVIPWLAWSVIFLMLKVIKGSVNICDVFSTKIISMIFNTEIIEIYWFFPALISIYLCMPVLSFISRSNEGDTVLKYIAVVTFITVHCLPYVFEVLKVDYNKDMLFPLGGGYILYPILGYLLNKAELRKCQRMIIYLAALASVAYRYVVTVGVSLNDGILYEGLFQYNQFHTVFLAAGVFVFFKYCFADRIPGRIITCLASSTYGVYLLHIFVEYQIVERAGLLNGYLWMFIAPIVTGLICVAIVMVIRMIPILRRLIP